jgi:hypothetical protein
MGQYHVSWLAGQLGGPWRHLPPRTDYRQIAENLRNEKLPQLSSAQRAGLSNVIVIEGHKRITGLLLCPQWLSAE